MPLTRQQKIEKQQSLCEDRAAMFTVYKGYRQQVDGLKQAYDKLSAKFNSQSWFRSSTPAADRVEGIEMIKEVAKKMDAALAHDKADAVALFKSDDPILKIETNIKSLQKATAVLQGAMLSVYEKIAGTYILRSPVHNSALCKLLGDILALKQASQEDLQSMRDVYGAHVEEQAALEAETRMVVSSS